jgi:transposase
VKRGKNDAADAEAICEAVMRPTMRFVPVKSAEQQANAMIYKVRELLVRQRTRQFSSALERACLIGHSHRGLHRGQRPIRPQQRPDT